MRSFMIVPMKKTIIIAQEKDALTAVDALGALGVLHVTHINPPHSVSVSAAHEDLALIDACCAIWSQTPQKAAHPRNSFRRGVPQKAARPSHRDAPADPIGRVATPPSRGARANQLWQGAL